MGNGHSTLSKHWEQIAGRKQGSTENEILEEMIVEKIRKIFPWDFRWQNFKLCWNFVINLNISQFNLLSEWSLQLFHQVRRVLGILYYSWTEFRYFTRCSPHMIFLHSMHVIMHILGLGYHKHKDCHDLRIPTPSSLYKRDILLVTVSTFS